MIRSFKTFRSGRCRLLGCSRGLFAADMEAQSELRVEFLSLSEKWFTD